MPRRVSAKKPILDILWDRVKSRGGSWEFDGEEDVKAAIAAYKAKTGVGYRNYADIPKVDFRDDLSDAMKRDDVFIVHLGGGRHRFVRGIEHSYHKLETVTEHHVETYKPSPLDTIERSSEAGDLSRILNLRIFHKFLYESAGKEFRIQLPGRKQHNPPLAYRIGPDIEIQTKKLQLEMDFVAEAEMADHPLDLCIAEAKSVRDDNFNIAQLYVPFRVLLERTREAAFKVRIRSLFIQTVSRRFAKENEEGVPPGWHRVARLYEYSFDQEDDLASIHHERSAEYVMVKV